jgi:hypothetical protein
MDIKKWVLLLLLPLLFLCPSCATRENRNALPDSPLDTALEELPEGSFGDILVGIDARWPDYIPDDIPPLPGDIDMIMAAPDTHIRMFYSNVSDEMIEDYLELLVQEGFNLEYRILVQEGFPDNSEERRQRGEYDDIVITKGVYRMTLSHYEGSATYDVYTSGFKEEAREATALQWPEDLMDVLPPPERCALASISPDGNAGYHISCKREDGNVDQDYLELLLSSGFQIEEEFLGSENEVTLHRLRREDNVVELSYLFEQFFTFRVLVDHLPEWPEVFGDSIPVPPRCEIANLIPTLEDSEVHVTCQPADQEVLSDYVQVLEELGFEESYRWVNDAGEIMIIDLENNQLAVSIMVNSPTSIGIQVSERE